MGWPPASPDVPSAGHHVTDHQCSVCHDPRKTNCGFCTANLCDTCVSGTFWKDDVDDIPDTVLARLLEEHGLELDEVFQEWKDGRWQPLNVVDLCEDCNNALHQSCKSCATSSQSLLECKRCNSWVCPSCIGDKMCWQCVKTQESLKDFLLTKMKIEDFSNFIQEFEKFRM